MSDSLMTANISPSVPFSSVKPALRASAIDALPARRPTFTLMPVPASESRRFCACAGPCEPQPMTPICLTPANAFGEQREEVTAAFDDLLRAIAHLDRVDREDLGRKAHGNDLRVGPEDRRWRLLRKMTYHHFCVAICATQANL